MMRRTRGKGTSAADAIVVSDLHLTDATPVSRNDDYLVAQEKKLIWLCELSKANDGCPVLCAGDVFHHWKASPWLCQMTWHLLPRPFVTIPGQHDLPMHSLEDYEKSALSLIGSIDDDVYVLNRMRFFTPAYHVTGFPFGTLDDLETSKLIPKEEHDQRQILMLHALTWSKKRPSWDKGSWTDLELLERYGAYYDLIVTGDNHVGFVTRRGGSLLVNPGSMMRMTADQKDYHPACYLYYAISNEVVPAYFPIQPNVHSTEHLDKVQERDARIAAYIERMEQDWKVGFSFRANLEAFFTENKVTEQVRKIIWQHLETGNS